MPRKVIVTAGHSDIKGGDNGASANGYVEGLLAIEFRDLIIKEMAALGVVAHTDDNKNALKQTLEWLKGKFSKDSILVDIHWNAGGGTGTEVIVPEDSSSFERQLSQRILDKICLIGGFKKRGVKSEAETARKKLGWMRPTAETVLIEVCFIDNKVDMVSYEANKVRLATEVAKVLLDFSNM
jgi:N-acetylmuramoyl-L-alanine amidase